jgi:hypothetical protein
VANHVELPEWIDRHSVERAYTRAQQALERRDHAYSNVGMRAARDRNPKLLKVLEQGANILDLLAEAQFGRYRRGIDIPYSHTVVPTEVQLWSKAFEFADKGEPLEHFCWIYGCAAELAGLQP